MDRVAAALARHLNLSTREAARLSIVGVSNDCHAFHRIFAGRDDRGAAPNCAHRADAIDSDAIGLILAATGLDLGPVFSLEDASR
jgi:hypothetical protein